MLLSKVSVLTSLPVQWLGLHAFTISRTGSIPAQGTKIPQTAWCPHPKTLSVYRDPISHLHQDWATYTALPLRTHCAHKFLSITVA